MIQSVTKTGLLIGFSLLFISFQPPDSKKLTSVPVKLIILGTLQDGGSPHPGCRGDCCLNPITGRKVVSLGLTDSLNGKTYLIEATPDLPAQMKELSQYAPWKKAETPDGIFLTHAHIGHYSGLMYLGREALNTSEVNVYAMPEMKKFLESNGPWSQLVSLKNIKIEPLFDSTPVSVTPNITVTPLKVPHRDEFSETVGFVISGPFKRVLFIPDIDKWQKWKISITELLNQVDYAFIDGTFYRETEVRNRSIREIPHPLISETMNLFSNQSKEIKNKIWFIHLNHTNPILDTSSIEYKYIQKEGYHVAQKNLEFEL